MHCLVLAIVLLAAACLVHAKPKCEADTFSGKQSCVYSTGTIDIAGIGNQIITRQGEMYYRRSIMTFSDPPEARAFLFRIDDRHTVKVTAGNATRLDVSCTRKVCTWPWKVMAVEGKDGRRTNPETMKKGGQIFAKFLADIRANEEGVPGTSVGVAFLQGGDARVEQ